MHAHVIRPYSHSLSDDEKLYRPDAERERDAARDPVSRTQMFLLREGILDEKGINDLEKKVEEELQVAVDEALAALPPAPESVLKYVYSPDVDPTSAAFDSQAVVGPDTADGKKPVPKTMADIKSGDYLASTGIKGTDYSATAPYYWAFWLDNKPASVGACSDAWAPPVFRA